MVKPVIVVHVGERSVWWLSVVKGEVIAEEVGRWFLQEGRKGLDGFGIRSEWSRMHQARWQGFLREGVVTSLPPTKNPAVCQAATKQNGVGRRLPDFLASRSRVLKGFLPLPSPQPSCVIVWSIRLPGSPVLTSRWVAAERPTALPCGGGEPWKKAQAEAVGGRGAGGAGGQASPLPLCPASALSKGQSFKRSLSHFSLY